MELDQALKFMSQLLDDMCAQLPKSAAFSTQQMGRQALGVIEREAKSEGDGKPSKGKDSGKDKGGKS